MCCTLTRSPPPIKPPLPRVPLSTSIPIPRLMTPSNLNECTHMATAFESPNLISITHPDLVRISHDLRSVTLFRERHATLSQSNLTEPTPFSPILGEYFMVLDHNLQHDLLAFPSTHSLPHLDPHPIPPNASDKSEPVRIALLTFIYTQLAIHPSSSALMRSLTSQLKSSLEFTADLHTSWAPIRATELLTWILFLGAHISAGQMDRAWFVALLASATTLLKCQTWDGTGGMKHTLGGFFYVERVFESSWTGIWEEAKILRDSAFKGGVRDNLN